MKKMTIESIAKMIETGFAAVSDDMAEMRTKMVSKTDVREIIHDEVPGIIEELVPRIIEDLVPGLIALETKPIAHELRELRRQIDFLEEHYRNIKGYAKEIDDLRLRVNVIEKFLKEKGLKMPV